LLSQLLFTFDKENPISDKAKTEFQQFQNNIPSTFVTTTQLREAAKNGSADILSISYQTYINTPEFSDYEYVPFGIRQDSPLYATTNDATKQEVLKKFSSYILEGNNQSKATSYGFNKLDDYSFEENNNARISFIETLKANLLFKNDVNNDDENNYKTAEEVFSELREKYGLEPKEDTVIDDSILKKEIIINEKELYKFIMKLRKELNERKVGI